MRGYGDAMKVERDAKSVRKGRFKMYSSSPKWFRWSTMADMAIDKNTNLYGWRAYVNDSRKGCAKDNVFKSVECSLISLRRMYGV